MPCCDICDPSLFDLARPPSPTTGLRTNTLRKGKPDLQAQIALRQWREHVYDRDHAFAHYDETALLSDDLITALTTVGPLSAPQTRGILKDKWIFFHQHAEELVERVVALKPQSIPIPRKPRVAKTTKPPSSVLPDTPMTQFPVKRQLHAEELPATSESERSPKRSRARPPLAPALAPIVAPSQTHYPRTTPVQPPVPSFPHTPTHVTSPYSIPPHAAVISESQHPPHTPRQAMSHNNINNWMPIHHSIVPASPLPASMPRQYNTVSLRQHCAPQQPPYHPPARYPPAPYPMPQSLGQTYPSTPGVSTPRYHPPPYPSSRSHQYVSPAVPQYRHSAAPPPYATQSYGIPSPSPQMRPSSPTIAYNTLMHPYTTPSSSSPTNADPSMSPGVRISASGGPIPFGQPAPYPHRLHHYPPSPAHTPLSSPSGVQDGSFHTRMQPPHPVWINFTTPQCSPPVSLSQMSTSYTPTPPPSQETFPFNV